jgi:DUF2892 family protein
MPLRNQSNLDRGIRLALGLALLALIFAGPQTYWGLLGLIPVGTALIGFCPLYRACGVTTDRGQRPMAAVGCPECHR